MSNLLQLVPRGMGKGEGREGTRETRTQKCHLLDRADLGAPVSHSCTQAAGGVRRHIPEACWETPGLGTDVYTSFPSVLLLAFLKIVIKYTYRKFTISHV